MSKQPRRKRIVNQRQMLIAEYIEHNAAATQAEVRQHLLDNYGIKASQPTISNDLKALKQAHFQRTDRAMAVVRNRLIDEYTTIYNEAMAAWYHSLEDRKIDTTEATGVAAAGEKLDAVERYKTTERIEGQTGNPAFLQQAQNALKSIRDMLGIDEAAKIAVAWEDELPEGYEPTEVQRQFAEMIAEAALKSDDSNPE